MVDPSCFDDPARFAALCGLTYVSDEEPGISRKKRGRGFSYFDPAGGPIRSRQTLARIRLLAIPPAWENVWICPKEAGHLQATGRDSQGRKQYLYHARWVHLRNEGKFSRLLDFGRALPDLRAQVEQDLHLRSHSRDKVLATVVGLLDLTFIRIGNMQYCQQNNAFGLTTLRDRHVEIEGTHVTFEFQGKSGVQRTVNLQDRRLARIIRECREVPGYRLFQYYDEEGKRQPVDSSDVNEYLREVSRCDFTAKDFRTWGGSVVALAELRDRPLPESETQQKKQLVEVTDRVAERLGNTRAVCRQYYIHPSVFAAYQEGWLTQACREAHRRYRQSSTHELSPDEQALMKVMRRYHRLHKPTALAG